MQFNWDEIYSYFSNNTAGQLIFSVLFIGLYLFLKSFFNKVMAKSDIQITRKRRWILMYRNVLNLSLILILFTLWFAELQTFAISILAVAAAIIIASKEFLLCFLGGLMRAVAHPFKVGDRIEVGEHRGLVLDSNFISTNLLELGPKYYSHQYSGRTLSIPNSLFLTKPIINETALSEFVVHTFVIPLDRSVDWELHEKVLLDASNEVCAEYLEKTKKYFHHIERKEGITMPAAEPRTRVQLESATSINLVARVPCPSYERGLVEQAIIRKYFELLKIN